MCGGIFFFHTGIMRTASCSCFLFKENYNTVLRISLYPMMPRRTLLQIATINKSYERKKGVTVNQQGVIAMCTISKCTERCTGVK